MPHRLKRRPLLTPAQPRRTIAAAADGWGSTSHAIGIIMERGQGSWVHHYGEGQR